MSSCPHMLGEEKRKLQGAQHGDDRLAAAIVNSMIDL